MTNSSSASKSPDASASWSASSCASLSPLRRAYSEPMSMQNSHSTTVAAFRTASSRRRSGTRSGFSTARLKATNQFISRGFWA